ncbi:MAG: tRNA glutamyl-Q(34) synthetase GluQRS [bacterium]
MIIGRFAPSPSGPLHLGSVVAAVGSWMAARIHNGQWKLRIEDIDKPRAIKGADKIIISELQRLGLEWDGPILYQSQRLDAYSEALEKLKSSDLIYACQCTRKQLAESSIYPGYCRNSQFPQKANAQRIRVDNKNICFTDKRKGTICQNLVDDVGDFIVKRKDGQFAYQLAVVVDDYFQEVNQVCRGEDLLISTPRQIYLQQQLGYLQPEYEHIPLIVDQYGNKLSKSDQAKPIANQDPLKLITYSLKKLGYPVSKKPSVAKLLHYSIDEFKQREFSA